MVDRIKLIMEYVQMLPAAFAETIGIGRSNLTHIFSGRNQPSLDLVKKILKAFPEIHPEWLILGMGNMLREENNIETQTEKVSMSYPAKPVLEHQTDLFENMLEETVTSEEPLPTKQTTEKKEIPPVDKSKQPARTPSVSKKISVKQPKSNISTPASIHNRISDSQDDKKITKIIFFFEDHSFEIYTPD